MRKLTIYALLTALALAFSSCGKYEDGPGLALSTKKARLTGTWRCVDAQNYSSIPNWDWEINGDETFRWEYSGGYEDGTWRFTEDKEVLSFYEDDGDKYEWEITRLTNDELWVLDSDGDQLEFSKQ